MRDIDKLKQDTKSAFDDSEIKKLPDAHKLKWLYCISATRLSTDANVIVGFNWGAKKGDPYDYSRDDVILNYSFKDLYQKKWLGSLHEVYPSLKMHLPNEDIDNCVHTNYCFFRSNNQSEITAKDLELSTPLFDRFIEIIKPKRIIGFSSQLRNHYINLYGSSIKRKQIKTNNRTIYYAAKGTCKIKQKNVEVHFLPHPNTHLTNVARDEAWDYCFN